ncbi:hypothetical protein [Planomonospora sp. ID82291]|uniref:hypothetical protein n=1 Tax=Planomonospora sp. ID82291 TaxID=2738136 RepID=UPI0018C3B300|nr:hypothetical protein [Planomonospora sp. ID82291]MBG0818717.1 hypothetical protein [Planomonospora sp. ID82291]
MTTTHDVPAAGIRAVLHLPLEVLLAAAIIRTLRGGDRFGYRHQRQDLPLLDRAVELARAEVTPATITSAADDGLFVVWWSPGDDPRTAAHPAWPQALNSLDSACGFRQMTAAAARGAQ